MSQRRQRRGLGATHSVAAATAASFLIYVSLNGLIFVAPSPRCHDSLAVFTCALVGQSSSSSPSSAAAAAPSHLLLSP